MVTDEKLMMLAVNGKHSHKFSDIEKEYFMFQMGLVGSFKTLLYRLLAVSDSINQNKLAKGYPEEVLVYRSWTHGNLAMKLREHLDPPQ